MGKLLERTEYLTRNWHDDVFDRPGPRRKLAGSGARRRVSHGERGRGNQDENADPHVVHRRLSELQKKGELLIRTRSQTLSAAAMRVSNKDCSPARIYG